VAAQEKVWRELQDALAALAPGAQHVIATKSGHDIQNTEPDLVITAVRQVVDAARGVLRGTNPSEVEQPTRFEMMITLKTALDIDIRPGCSPAPTR
jgi:hypothetical protein